MGVKTAVAVLLVPVLLLGGCTVLLAGGAGKSCTATAGGTEAAAFADRLTMPEQVGRWNKDQLLIAAILIDEAAEMGVPLLAQQNVVMTAMGESSLQILDHGDAVDNSTIGVLQQGESYGTRAQRLDPKTAAHAYLTRLLGVEGWQTMEPTIVAHTVQINQDPFHYRPFWADAQAVVEALTHRGAGGNSASCAAGGDVVLPLAPNYSMTEKYGYRGDIGLGTNSFHAAVDLADIPGGSCDAPVLSSTAGQVTKVENSWTSVQSPDGYTVSYLHMPLSGATVQVGDQVTAGQQLGVIGSEGQSTGCHLDFRVDITGNTDPRLEGITPAAGAGSYIDPEAFFTALGVELCPADWCRRNY